ncbi:glycine betaine ABC transporter substrate-binding protein [Litorihabitans aurantiacus]|uniref:Glycine/betaine ABC transporter substrate-binding protein n=1 Tax=Litorihabitans aurantiacus TaxID=1930061 RepID=A0AA37XEW4_9MICO|nr:glycine betaine ABC transporter substrate-binding protein [Litorihabitans aurantiacus]GMA32024.1 glycine/betaine ABC transporter substrate-binding protein [Litorihabitans aurantiacus]
MTRVHRPVRRRRRSLVGGVGALAALALGGCGLQPAASFVPEFGEGSLERLDLPEGASVTVTSKNFTEQLILGKIAVLAAQAAGFTVTDLSNVPGSQPVRELMLSGGADITWEYTGTAWLTYLGQEEGIPDPAEQFAAVAEADGELGLTWSDPAPLNNTYAFAVSRDNAEKYGLETISDLATVPVGERTLCVEPEFNSRADGLTPLLEHYELPRGPEGIPDNQISVLDLGAVYAAIDRGNCVVGEVFSSDGRIPALDLVVLEDDRAFFPAYNASVVFYAETLETYPGLQDVFADVSARITDDLMRELNRQVDVDGEEPADVAYAWMVQEGFITEP